MESLNIIVIFIVFDNINFVIKMIIYLNFLVFQPFVGDCSFVQLFSVNLDIFGYNKVLFGAVGFIVVFFTN